MKKYVFTCIIVLTVAVTIAVWQRHRILFPLFSTGEPVPPVMDAPPIPGAEPFGDEGYFVVLELSENTFAIAEPYAWTRSFNYLFLGSERALLFDAGAGHYDIRPVLKALTDLPVTFMPSHFHYDHTGQGSFERIVLIDLPHIREQADGDTLTLTWGQHLGEAEGIPAPTWTIDEWIAPGADIDLGDRRLTLLYTPGHTDNSVSLYDTKSAWIFSGDFISPNIMTAITPTAGMGDYLQTATKLADTTKDHPHTKFHSAHGQQWVGLPRIEREAVVHFRDQLRRIRNGELEGEGAYPVIYMISEETELQAEPRWLQDWSPTYPETTN